MADPGEVVEVRVEGGIRQDVHRSRVPAGAVYRATNVRRRGLGALGPRTDMLPAGLSVRPGALALAGSTHALGEHAGRQVVAANGSVWDRGSSAEQWNEVGRVSRFRPVRADVLNTIDAMHTNIGAAPLVNQCVAAVGGTLALGYSSAINNFPIFGPPQVAYVTFEVRTEDGRMLRRFSYSVTSAPDRIFPRVVALPGAGDAGQFVFAYADGTGIVCRTYDVATDAIVFGPVPVATMFVNLEGFDAIPNTPTSWVLGLKSGSVQLQISQVGADLAVLGSVFPTITAGSVRVNSICLDGTAGENVYALWSIAGVGTRGVVVNSAVSAVVTTETLILAEAANETFSRPAMGRLSATSRFVVQHKVVQTLSLIPANVDTNVCFSLSSALVGGTQMIVCNCIAAASPECPSANEAQLWVDFNPGLQASSAGSASRPDGHRSAMLSLSLDGSGVRNVEITTDLPATNGTNLHKPRLAHGARYTWFPASVRLASADPGSAAGNLTAPSLVAYEADADSAGASRQFIEAAGALNVCGGGVITEVVGERGNNVAFRLGMDNGMPTPFLFGAVSTATAGGLVTGATYSYCVVFTYLDSTGRVHRSAPSNVCTLEMTGGLTSARLRISGIEVGDRIRWQSGSLSAHIYRTAANGSTFYRITSNTDAPGADTSPYTSLGFQDYLDLATDASISTNEILYTAGGVLANQPAPAHRFAVFGDARIWTAGTWDARRIECSRLIVPGEPVEFTRTEQFRTYLPEPVTALGYMDGSLVAFGQRSIYLVNGTGPNDEGSPALAAPTRLPSDVGCSDQRSVVELSAGLVFQAAGGDLYLLPRGFGPPQLLSAPVQDELAGQSVIGVARADYNASTELATGLRANIGVRVAVFLLGSTRLVLDEESLQWVSVDSDAAPYAFVGTWGGFLALGAASLAGANDLLLEGTSFGSVVASVETGDVAPFGLFGRGAVRGVQALFEMRGSSRVSLDVYFDGEYPAPAPGDEHVIELTLPVGAEGRRERVLFKPGRIKCNSVRLLLTWQSRPSGPAGLFLGFGLEVEKIGNAEVAPQRRA